MVDTPQKTHSITLSTSAFDVLNGELSDITNDADRRQRIVQYFYEKYGGRGGKLEVKLNGSKVTLRWLQSNFDSEAESLHKEALSKARQRKFQEAIQYWVKAISLNPTDPDYFFSLGVAFFEIKNYNESIENLKSAIELCPIYHRSHLVLGTIYLKIRKYDLAENHLKASLKFNPGNALTYLNLGTVYSILRRYSEAVQMYKQSLELTPKEARAYFGLGKIYVLLQEYEPAAECFRRVVDYDEKNLLTKHAKRALAGIASQADPADDAPAPTDSKVAEKHYQEGYKAFLFTDYERAIAHYNEYLKSNYNDDSIWSALGEAALRVGDTEKALSAFKSAIKYNPRKGLYYKQIAVAFDSIGKIKEVIECLKKAKALGKNDSITNTLWGKSLISLDSYEEAVIHLEQALRLNPNNLVAKYLLGLAYMRTGETNRAQNCFQEIIKTPINSPLKMEAESLLNRL